MRSNFGAVLCLKRSMGVTNEYCKKKKGKKVLLYFVFTFVW